MDPRTCVVQAPLYSERKPCKNSAFSQRPGCLCSLITHVCVLPQIHLLHLLHEFPIFPLRTSSLPPHQLIPITLIIVSQRRPHSVVAVCINMQRFSATYPPAIFVRFYAPDGTYRLFIQAITINGRPVSVDDQMYAHSIPVLVET